MFRFWFLFALLFQSLSASGNLTPTGKVRTTESCGYRIAALAQDVNPTAAELMAQVSGTPPSNRALTMEAAFAAVEGVRDAQLEMTAGPSGAGAAGAAGATQGWGREIPQHILLAAQGHMNEMLRIVYGVQPVRTIFPGDKILLHHNPLLQVVSLGEGVKIPRAIMDEAEEGAEQLRARTRMLEAQLSIYTELLGDDYRPLYFDTILNAVRQVVGNGILDGDKYGYLSPLIQIVKNNSDDFLASLSHGAMLDETQDELLGKLSLLIRAGLITEEVMNASERRVYEAVHKLMVCRTRRWTGFHSAEALEADEYATLQALAVLLSELETNQAGADPTQLEWLNPIRRALSAAWAKLGQRSPIGSLQMIARDLGENLERERKWAGKLHTARIAFAEGRLASKMAYLMLDQIARPDGVRYLETNSILKWAWVEDMEGFDTLRLVVAEALDEHRKFYDPALRREFDMQMSTMEILRTKGPKGVDALLVSQIHTGERIETEFERARVVALEKEVAAVKEKLTAKQLKAASEKLEKVARGVMNVTTAHILEFAGGTVPGRLFKAMRDTLDEDPKDKNAVAQIVGQIRQLPENSYSYLREVKLLWKGQNGQRLALFNAEGGVELEMEQKTRIYFTQFIRSLDERAAYVIERNVALQRGARTAHRGLSTAEVDEIDTDQNTLMKTTSDVVQALEQAFRDRAEAEAKRPLTKAESDKARADAITTFMFYIEGAKSLRRAIGNDRTGILPKIGRLIIDDALGRLYSDYKPRFFGTEFLTRIRSVKHYVWKIVGAVIVIGAGGAYWYWQNDGLMPHIPVGDNPAVVEPAQTDSTPPPVVRPAEDPDDDTAIEQGTPDGDDGMHSDDDAEPEAEQESDDAA